MSYIWDLNNQTSDYIHIKIKLNIHVLLVLESHIWHVLNYIYVDLYFPDVSDLVQYARKVIILKGQQAQ